MGSSDSDPDATVLKPRTSTLPSRPSFDELTLVNPSPGALDAASLDAATFAAGERYEVRRELGKGGMGVVQLCHDVRVGRDVARKVMRPELSAKPDVRARFLREARVQGQLEHPGIVPVYDVGVDDRGAAYFTMKCLRGRTLSEVLRGMRAGDAAMVRAYSRRKLLTAFSSLCLAVDYAHARGVLHRDIKPANVMLGAYGEIYVLDWGIAKVLDDGTAALDMDGAPLGGATVPGELLGTPGYIAPEQAWGRTELLDARSDVYALGCILFEVLTLQPLHPRTDTLETLRSTTHGADARASVRAPDRDIPPELDAICVQATTVRQSERTPSARALHDAIERFLDGDRNIALRRDLAAEHAARAELAVETALGAGAGAEQARRTALGEVGGALALDPTNERALTALQRIFTEPPREVPAEVAEELEASVGERHKFQLREGILADFLGLACALPFVVWMRGQSSHVFAVMALLTCISAAFKLAATRNVRAPNVAWTAYFAFAFNVLAVLCTSRGFGPLLFMPLLLVMFAHGYSTTPWSRFRAAILGTALLVQLAAVAVEVSGLLPRSYDFRDGAMIILPRAATFTETPALASLTMFAVFMLVVPARMMGRLQRMLRDAERRAFVQSWQLRQLLPPSAERAEK